MSSQEAIEKVKIIILDLINQMGIEADIEIREQPGTVVYNIRTEDTNMLIGRFGINLQSLQYICRVLVKRSMEKEFNFLIDVDNYKKKREAHLQELANQAYKESVNSNTAVALKSMPAYERRIIHTTLSDKEDVSTVSVGDEPNRMVVIKPQNLEMTRDSIKISFSPGEEYKSLSI